MVDLHFHIHEDVDLSHVLAILNRIENKMSDLTIAEDDLTAAVQGITSRLAPLQTALSDATAANATLTDTVASLTSLNETDQAALTQAATDAATALQAATDAAGSIESNVGQLNSLAQPPAPPA